MDRTDDPDRDARRAARAAQPLRRFALGTEPPDDLRHLTADERVALVWEVSVRAWRMSGRELPSVPRSQWPGRLVRQA